MRLTNKPHNVAHMLTYTTAGQILDTTYFCGNKDSVSYCTCITQCAVQAVKLLPYNSIWEMYQNQGKWRLNDNILVKWVKNILIGRGTSQTGLKIKVQTEVQTEVQKPDLGPVNHAAGGGRHTPVGQHRAVSRCPGRGGGGKL